MIIFRKFYNLKSYIYNSCRTRWFKRIVTKCGNNVKVFGKIDVVNPRNIIVGNDVTFNHGCYINAFNPIRIGNDVVFSANVSLISTGIDVNSWLTGNKRHLSDEGISIGDHVWVGAGSQILNNVHINGSFVVIAAGAVVNKDINKSYCIVGGCPAKVIKYLK